ncbi:hypothetical protein C2G38_2048691 [Gigaspora rosea]|uniref:Transmembrane protein n=1 Tax=Gigaspora rosea TaxID=44941 RepID=A0A397U534_9GLOM|nr:hypothetical protein C2G38_2048691 [Gigaspora rosea]
MTRIGYYALLCCCSPLLILLLLAFLCFYLFWGILLSPIWLTILLVLFTYFGYKWIRNDDDEIFCNDPLLVIEYNQPGLASRTITPPGLAVRNITENDVSAVIRGTPNYTPITFPRADLAQSNSVFAFNDMQTIEHVIARLYENYHNNVTGRRDPIVGRVYWVKFRRANTFDVCERLHVFD